MTKEEASERQLDNIIASSKWFCPLINGLCKSECYCFVPSIITNDKNATIGGKMDGNRFGFVGAYCDNKIMGSV